MHRFEIKIRFGLALTAALALAGCRRTIVYDLPANSENAAKIRAELNKGGAAAPEATAAAKTWKGFATLKGRFVLEGAAPKLPELIVNKDPEVCGVHPLVNEGVVLGQGNGLANVVITIASKEFPISPDVKPLDAAGPVTLDNKGCRFQPHVIAATAAGKFAIHNSDSIGHNSSVSGKNNPPANPTIPAGEAVPVALPEAENLPIKVTCGIHPWMVGWIAVRKDPYIAISDKDGNFELANLPAGDELELQVWHEQAQAGLALDKPELKWTKKGRFTVKLDEGETKTLDLKVPAAALGG